MIFVDSNILLDVLTQDSLWAEWSIARLRSGSIEGPLVINEVVFAEIGGFLLTEDDLRESVRTFGVQLERTPTAALFLAGQAFRKYRRSGGVRTGVLPDFFIGAHAQVAGIPVLTRDVRRFRTHFPDVELITPEA